MLNSLLSAILQVVLFSIIPFIWWFIFWRKETNFFIWLGLKKISVKSLLSYVVSFIVIIVILFIPSLIATTFITDESALATSEFAGLGFSVFIPALLFAFIQTGLSEEILFRGFLAKRLIHTFGFMFGNSMQGLLFGLLHGFMFMSVASGFGVVVITLITGMTGFLLGWINEKQSNGSIISSWLIHGTVNMIAALLTMFNYL